MGIVKLVVTAAAVWVAVQLVDGLDYSGSWLGLLGIAVMPSATSSAASRAAGCSTRATTRGVKRATRTGVPLRVTSATSTVLALTRPIVTRLSLPLVLPTVGLFLLIINPLIFGLTIWISEGLDLGLTSTGFAATFLGALVVTVVSWIGEAVLGRD